MARIASYVVCRWNATGKAVVLHRPNFQLQTVFRACYISSHRSREAALDAADAWNKNPQPVEADRFFTGLVKE